ncbi:MAG TPA: hypothetical protein VFS76_17365 [Pyrinomonadaceae bacterium]|nr:hypothetical protein [Pyrinomonadaceae bacterium]
MKQIENEWQAIDRGCINQAVNTGRVTWCFGERTCRVCVAVRRFDS